MSDLVSIQVEDCGAVSIHVRGHQLQADKPASEGGADRGLSPVEMLVASLGACIGLLVGDYCRQHGYRDGSTAVHLTYQLGESPRRIVAITVDVEIPKDVPEEKKDAIRRIARLCPVHHTMAQPPLIDLEVI